MLLFKLALVWSSIALIRAELYVSPCPSTFQIAVDPATRRQVGVISLHIPKTQVYQFNVTALFIPLTNSLEVLPQLKVENGEQPQKVIENILRGRDVRLLATYQQDSYKLYKILLDNEVMCEDYSVTLSQQLYNAKAHETFLAPVDVISRFKDNFPIRYNEPGCGELKEEEVIRKHQLLSYGGERAAWKDWPWVVSIFVSNDLVCTGNLISPSVVLTAAHCFGVRTIPHQRIKIGVFNGQNFTVWGYLRHKSFNEHKDDIALVYLSEDITDPRFVPVCITEKEVDTSQGALVSFGEDELGRTGNLQYLDLNSVTNEVCRSSNADLANLVQPSHFCAGNLDGTGPCSGDSGSGYLVKHGENKWYLRGLLSASLKDGDKCDLNNYAIFINVVNYINWIPRGTSGGPVASAGPIATSPRTTTLRPTTAPSLTALNDPMNRYRSKFLAVNGACGGLRSSAETFLSERKWLMEVRYRKDPDSTSFWVGWAFLISPKHVFTVESQFRENDDGYVFNAFTAGAELISKVTKVTRLLPGKWYSPIILELETPQPDIEPICLDTLGRAPLEKVIGVDASDDPDSLEYGENRNVTLVRSQSCLLTLPQERKNKLQELFDGGVNKDAIYCNPVGVVELALKLQKTEAGSSYYSFFAWWITNPAFHTVHDYLDQIVDNSIES